METATCFLQPQINPDGCAFVEQEAANLTDFAKNEWVIDHSRDAVDLDGDGYRDLAVLLLSVAAIPRFLCLSCMETGMEPSNNRFLCSDITMESVANHQRTLSSSPILIIRELETF